MSAGEAVGWKEPRCGRGADSLKGAVDDGRGRVGDQKTADGIGQV